MKGGSNIFEFQNETSYEYNMYIKVWAGKSFKNAHDTFVSLMAIVCRINFRFDHSQFLSLFDCVVDCLSLLFTFSLFFIIYSIFIRVKRKLVPPLSGIQIVQITIKNLILF